MKAFKNKKEFAKELARLDKNDPLSENLNISHCTILAEEIISVFGSLKRFGKSMMLKKKSKEILRNFTLKIADSKLKNLTESQKASARRVILQVASSTRTLERSMKALNEKPKKSSVEKPKVEETKVNELEVNNNPESENQ